MGKNNNIIEINGKRYDARTGAALDGLDLSASNAVPVTVMVEPAPVAKAAAPASPKPSRRTITKAKPQAAHQPQHAKTLMRHTVKKPAGGPQQRVKAHGHTDALLAKPAAAIRPKSSVHSVNDRRLRHAKQAAKSTAVSRFRPHQPSAAAIPVTVHKPATATAPHHRPPAAPRATPAKTHKPRTTAELLEHALQEATSHLQPPPPSPKRRRVLSRRASLSALTTAVVILVGVIGFQNVTTVRLRMASSKAGFTAALPDQQPAGYHLSHLNYSPGTVAAHYQSNSDGRSYAITEKASQWDSNTLRDQFLASNGHNYQTVESAGRTLYLYGQNAATWVSGGVWYQVQTNGSLSSDQLVKLATSM